MDDVIEHPWLSAVWATSGDENEENEDPPEDCWFQKFPKSMVSRFDPVDTNKSGKAIVSQLGSAQKLLPRVARRNEQLGVQSPSLTNGVREDIPLDGDDMGILPKNSVVFSGSGCTPKTISGTNFKGFSFTSNVFSDLQT